MNSITGLSPQQLRRAADLQERIQELQSQLAQILGGAEEATPAPTPARASARGRRRKLSPQGLANIRAGVAKRMMGQVGTSEEVEGKKPKKRKMSPAARAAIAEAARARWAKAKASGRNKL